MILPQAPGAYDQNNESQTRNLIIEDAANAFKKGEDVRLERGERLIMKSESGFLFNVVIGDDGTISTEAIP